MGPITESLLRLQEIETALWSLREAQSAKIRTIAAQQRKLEQLQKQVELKTDQVKHMQVDAASQELDLKTQEAEIGKLRNALNTARTNKEYAAILTQINSDTVESTRLEERVLALLAETDQMQSECSQGRKEIEKSQSKLESLRQALEDEQERNTQRLASLQANRTEVASAIPPQVLQEFARMGESYSGHVMAAVTSTGKRNARYSCSGCHMGITIDTVDALLSKDEVRQCPHCQRLLYVDLKQD